MLNRALQRDDTKLRQNLVSEVQVLLPMSTLAFESSTGMDDAKTTHGECTLWSPVLDIPESLSFTSEGSIISHKDALLLLGPERGNWHLVVDLEDRELDPSEWAFSRSWLPFVGGFIFAHLIGHQQKSQHFN